MFVGSDIIEFDPCFCRKWLLKEQQKPEEVPEKKLNDKELWDSICNESEELRQGIEKYKREKTNQHDHFINPQLELLHKHIFPLLKGALIETIEKAEEEKSFHVPKTTFNGIDHLSEYFYNSNPKYPERKSNWTYIFDLDWVKEYLAESPRPVFPFRRIWSKEFATLKIQSFFRGYQVRKREDVQELRRFWKTLKTTAFHLKNSKLYFSSRGDLTQFSEESNLSTTEGY